MRFFRWLFGGSELQIVSSEFAGSIDATPEAREAIMERVRQRAWERGRFNGEIRRLREDNNRLLTVADKAKWLVELVHRDAARDGADAQCLRNHGLVWSELDKALQAAELHPNLDRSPIRGRINR